MNISSVITLTTDFGLSDHYAGTMKGVILSINPKCTIVDITHQIASQDVMGGCFTLSESYTFFPERTIHVAVVDPGVGSARRSILVETKKYLFVGPDNGIFSFVLAGKDVKNVFEITENTLLLPSRSTTFHGRDVFSPAAAHLSKGIPPERFGSPVKDCFIISLPEPVLLDNNEAEGEIVHIDWFGNLTTNLPRELVEKLISAGSFCAEIKGAHVLRLLPYYAHAEENEIFCLFGSSGLLEVSVKNKRAADLIGARRGDKIRIKSVDI